MSDTSTHLGLPYLLAAQAQKHVTHNESLRLLDTIVQLSVLDRTRTTPPVSPADGDRHLVATGAAGLWAGWDLNVAFWVDGVWMRLLPRPGWLVWVAVEDSLLVYSGAGWLPLVGGAKPQLSRSPSGFWTGMETREGLVTALSGSFVETGVVIPDRAICLGVTTKVVTTITGASSFSCGIAGEAAKFGSGIGVAAGSTNRGVIGPQPVYADTNVRLTATGGAFSGGAVRVGMHLIMAGVG
jgi:hypothetical protein